MIYIAHRGYGAADNSIESFENAIKENFNILELDLHQTLDNKLVLSHDLFIGSFNIEETKFQLLRDHYPDLLELKDVFNKFSPNTYSFYLDLKGRDDIANVLITFVKKNNINCKNIYVASFNKYHIEILKNSKIDWKVGFITCNTYLLHEYDTLLKDIDFVCVDWTSLSYYIVDLLHDSCDTVFAYTCSSQQEYEYICKYKIEGIVSDILLK